MPNRDIGDVAAAIAGPNGCEFSSGTALLRIRALFSHVPVSCQRCLHIVFAITELTAGDKESSVEAILVFSLVYGVLSLVVGYLAKAPAHRGVKALFSMTPKTAEWNGAHDKEGVQTWDPGWMQRKKSIWAPVLDEDNIYESDGAYTDLAAQLNDWYSN